MTTIIDQIEHFVVLMLENRSYDLMLGGLYGAVYDGVSSNMTLAPSLPYDGPTGLSQVEVVRGTPPNVFAVDPEHGFDETMRQIYGAPPPDTEANMMGFARSLYRKLHGSEESKISRLRQYATVFNEGRLPVLHTLAIRYGVCTHWFAALPSSTSPNRAFTHAGTSLGHLGQTDVGLFWPHLRNKTVFDALRDDLTVWRVYHDGPPHLWVMGTDWMADRRHHFRKLKQLKMDVQNGSLPKYTFVEPRHWLLPSAWSSQHPPSPVSAGERLVAEVYDALIANPSIFRKTLLLIVYDEHGGFFDHVVPPGHPGYSPPPGVIYDVVHPDPPELQQPGAEFRFDRLGVRVPAVVVSPWIPAGTVIGWRAADPAMRRTFDHTSIIATVKKLVPDLQFDTSKRVNNATALDIPLTLSNPRLPADYGGPLLPDFSEADYGPIVDAPADVAGPGKELFDVWTAAGGAAEDFEAHVASLLDT